MPSVQHQWDNCSHTMRELHGVAISSMAFFGPELKQRALLFDKFHLWPSIDYINRVWSPELVAEITFLQKAGFLLDAPCVVVGDEAAGAAWTADTTPPDDYVDDPTLPLGEQLVGYAASRRLAVQLNENAKIEAVPVFVNGLLERTRHMPSPGAENVLSVALKALPAFHEDCAWDAILDFKSELKDKQWGLRRWLHSVATKNLTEAEVQDELEWLLNEYTKAMTIHHIKAAQSFVDVFVISPLEIIENLVKFNWGKIAKGVLSVKKRKVELMEAEMKAPGRECAYVFDARKRFAKIT
jgi:hypothetical protein